MGRGSGRDVCPWGAPYEEVARDMIIEDSKKKPGGKALAECCGRACYHRQCLFSEYIMVFILFAAGAFMLGFSLSAKVTNIRALTFLPTECTPLSMKYTGENRTCRCPAPKNQVCWKKYPCINVQVSFNAGSQFIANKTLYVDYDNLNKEQSKCVFNSGSCTEYDPLAVLKEIVAIGNKTFKCFYDSSSHDVVYRLQALPGWALALLIAGPICLGFSLVVGPLLYCCCGCKHLWGTKPTPAVLQEADAREQAASAAVPKRESDIEIERTVAEINAKTLYTDHTVGAGSSGVAQGLEAGAGSNYTWENTDYGQKTYSNAYSNNVTKYDWE